MRILVISTEPYSHNGVATVITNLYKNDIFAKENMLFFLPSGSNRKMVEELFFYGDVRLYDLKCRRKNPFKYTGILCKLIKEKKIDIVHIHGNSHTTVFELIAAKLAGCKVRIVHAHNTSCRHMTSHKLLSPLFNALCTYRLACGEEAGSFMYGKKPFTVIKNATDTQKFTFDKELRQKYRSELKIAPDTVLVGHIGVIDERKNQLFLVRAFAEYQKTNSDSHLVLIGDGRERENVKNEILSLGIKDKVSMLGVREDVQGLLNALDVFALPSHYEGLPLTAIEAQTNGLPCLISANVTPDVDKTGNVKFLPITDTLPWSDSLAEISVMSDGERESACLAAIEKIRESGYDIKQEAVKLHALYSSLIK